MLLWSTFILFNIKYIKNIRVGISIIHLLGLRKSLVYGIINNTLSRSSLYMIDILWIILKYLEYNRYNLAVVKINISSYTTIIVHQMQIFCISLHVHIVVIWYVFILRLVLFDIAHFFYKRKHTSISKKSSRNHQQHIFLTTQSVCMWMKIELGIFHSPYSNHVFFLITLGLTIMQNMAICIM